MKLSSWTTPSFTAVALCKHEQKQNGSLITEQDQLGHCSPTATQTLQAGFPHEEMGIIQT